MKDIFESLERAKRVDYLLDTCFLIWCFKEGKMKQLQEFCSSDNVGLTSFNAEEFNHVSHKIHDDVKIHARKFFKDCALKIVSVPVHPGDWKGEHDYVRRVSPSLDAEEHDASDAVMLAAAISIGANVITRDKHDIFNARLENFVEKSGITILKSFP